jgi:hypothetical protein
MPNVFELTMKSCNHCLTYNHIIYSHIDHHKYITFELNVITRMKRRDEIMCSHMKF